MNWQKKLPYLALILLVVIAYGNALQNDFLWDDEFLVEKNSYLRDVSHLPKMLVSNSTAGFGGQDNFYRPTQNVFYLFIYQVFGYNKVAFHFGNIALHFINACLLFFVILQIFRKRQLAFIASALWAVHPTHTEAITYISGTADPLGLLFLLLSIIAFPKTARQRSMRRIFASLVLFFLALVSKEAMIVGPGVLLIVLGVTQTDHRWQWRTYLPTVPHWLVALFYMFLRQTVLNFDETYNFYKVSNIYTENVTYRIYTYLATLPEYLKILIIPVDLHMERDFPVHTEFLASPVIWGVVLLTASLASAGFLYLRKQKAWALFSWLWFFGTFVPMMGILIPVNSFLLEHWLYVPSIGFFIAVSFFIIQITSASVRLTYGLVGLLLCTLMFLTHTRNKDWRTPITFYRNILQYSAGSARVHNNIAMAYSEIEDFPKAINHYEKAIEISDTYPQTHYNLARALIRDQRYQEAMEHLNRSIDLQPSFSHSIELKQKLTDFLNKQRP